VKRLLDFLVSMIALIVLSPFVLAIAIGVMLSLGRPILFRQMRPGLNGRPFQLIKFRTMREPRPGDAASEADRLSGFGRFLRSTSLDELPELWNVLKGEMSLVGPRPLLMRYLDRYSRRQARRHDVRPGLTGWAQVNGRNTVKWPERLELDVWYVENRSFALDMRIILATVGLVLRRSGISAEGSATMPEFLGAEEPASDSPASSGSSSDAGIAPRARLSARETC
jgi:lipopolysaccharide/colanic/teichoic acid biosynthesis glycosyltransferase